MKFVTATSLDCHAATKLEVELLISTLFDRRFILVNILEKLILGTNLNFIKYLPQSQSIHGQTDKINDVVDNSDLNPDTTNKDVIMELIDLSLKEPEEEQIEVSGPEEESPLAMDKG